jgi:ribosomal protein L40E
MTKVVTRRTEYVIVMKFCMYCPAELPIEDDVLICRECYEKDFPLSPVAETPKSTPFVPREKQPRQDEVALQKRIEKIAARNRKVPAAQRAADT